MGDNFRNAIKNLGRRGQGGNSDASSDQSSENEDSSSRSHIGESLTEEDPNLRIRRRRRNVVEDEREQQLRLTRRRIDEFIPPAVVDHYPDKQIADRVITSIKDWPDNYPGAKSIRFFRETRHWIVGPSKSHL